MGSLNYLMQSYWDLFCSLRGIIMIKIKQRFEAKQRLEDQWQMENPAFPIVLGSVYLQGSLQVCGDWRPASVSLRTPYLTPIGQPHNLWGPVQDEKAETLVQKTEKELCTFSGCLSSLLLPCSLLSNAVVYPIPTLPAPTPRALPGVEAVGTSWVGMGRQVLENSSWRPGECGNAGLQGPGTCPALSPYFTYKSQNQRRYVESFKTAASERQASGADPVQREACCANAMASHLGRGLHGPQEGRSMGWLAQLASRKKLCFSPRSWGRRVDIAFLLLCCDYFLFWSPFSSTLFCIKMMRERKVNKKFW